MKTKLFAILLTSTISSNAFSQPINDQITNGIMTIEQINENLANIINSRLNPSNDPTYSFVVGDFGGYPIGALLHPGRTKPKSYNACRYNGEIPTLSVNFLPTTTEAYKRGLTGDITAALNQLRLSGINLSNDRTFTIGFSNSTAQILDDVQLGEILNSDSCKTTIDGTYYLIRGFISTRRDFSFKTVRTRAANLSIPNFANFTFSANPSTRIINISDERATQIIAVVTEVRPNSNNQISSSQLTTSSGVNGRIYFQADINDNSNNPSRLLDNVRRQFPNNVVATIESLPSNRMPSISQVRYFNEEDRNYASQVLTTVRNLYPNAILTKVRLPAPRGQIEVWMTK